MVFEREKKIIERELDDANLLNLFKETGAFLAGGAVASVFSSTRINDFDVYFSNIESFEKCSKELEKLSNSKLVFETPNAETYEVTSTNKKIRVQLIKAFTGDAESVFQSFDFTCCMGAYHFMNREFKFHEDFLTHLSQRRLVFNTSTPYPLSSLVRVRKYIQKKGFNIDAVQMVKMALTIHKLPLDDYKALKEQLQGVDIMLFKSFLDKLEDKKEEPYEFEEFVEWLEQVYNDLGE